MKLKKSLIFSGFLFLALIISCTLIFTSQECPAKEATDIEELETRSCTSILVGKKASADGSTMTTHTCDCGICDWTWRCVPADDHKLGSARKIYHISQYRTWPPEQGLKWEKYKEDYTGTDIPQVSHTYAYKHGMFAYMNENQVAIGESTIGCRLKMRNTTPSALLDLTMLTILGMERSKTAREFIHIVGSLAEKYGYGFNDGGEMLAVSDPNEVWIFEIMPVGPLWTPDSGKPGVVWCAQRVPDDHVSICPNESRIGEIDLSNTDYFMASSNVISYAVENGFYDSESGKPFSWKKAYSPSKGSATSTHARRGRLWRFLTLVAPSQNFSPDTEDIDFPFSVKPDNKLSLQNIINITRDKYQDNIYDPAKGLKGGPFSNPNYFRSFKLGNDSYRSPRCICVNNVEYTTITQCRDWLPNPIGGIVWLAFGAQDTSCYMPIYAGSTDIPESFKVGDHFEFNKHSARWAADYVDFHTQVAYSYAIKDVRKAQEKWESSAIERIPVIDEAALKLHEKNPARAIKFLTNYTLNNSNSVVNAWWKLGDDLLVKYNHFRIYDPVKRKSGRIQTPEWWNKAVVEHDKLSPIAPPSSQKPPEKKK